MDKSDLSFQNESLLSQASTHLPLAVRMRPQTLDEFVGQEHLTGEGKIIRRMIESHHIFPVIFWAPPGTGKTTLARIMATATQADFVELSATSAGVAEVKAVVEKAVESLKMGEKTILFLDEIHRFTKAQQDRLLPAVEEGTITLIGATTENPSFGVISPLLSRCRVLVLKNLTKENLQKLIDRALQDKERGLGHYNVTVDDNAADFLITISGGDARVVLNTLEVAVTLIDTDKKITLSDIEEALQKKALRYDKAEDEHYNTISAFIKSMRVSDPDAALYYLSRMIKAGEDPRFIARRMIIFASEDIGMAQPTALVVANEVFRACEIIGLPECSINLAHGVVYLCHCAKDRSAVNALQEASADAEAYGNLPIPLEILNAPTKLMKDLGYAKDYKWSKDYVGPTSNKSLLPEKLKNKKYYHKKEK